MNFKVLRVSVLGLVAFAAVAWLVNERRGDDASKYIPRSEFNTTQYADGAFEYYRMVKGNVYTGKIEKEDVLGMRNAVRKLSKNSSAKNGDIIWTNMGPDNVGGRTRAILPFPNDVNTIIAGGVSGGLFKSTNGGQNWSRLVNFQENLVVGSIAMLGNGSIYVGTGHSRESQGGLPSGNGDSGFMGGGLFVSNDQGETWGLVSDFAPTAFDPDDNWANTDDLAADPSNPNRLWIASNFGLFPYIHGEAELQPMANGTVGGEVGSLSVSSDGQHIAAAIGPRVYVSLDFGETFELSNGDEGSPFQIGGNSDIDLKISQSDKNFIFASVANSTGGLQGIYGSTNGGITWSVMAVPAENPSAQSFAPFSNGITQQGNYDNMITVAPSAENGDKNIIMGGIALHSYFLPNNTTPCICNWEQINSNFASGPGQAPSPAYVHSDIHTDAWDSEGKLYIGCDGGIFRTASAATGWAELNFNYTTTQYYAIAFNPSGQVLGGLQDNGTLFLGLNGSTPGYATRFTGGDGFSCEISQEYPNFMFSTIYNGAVFRSTDGGLNVAPLGNLLTVSSGGGSDFYTDIALHENPNNQFSEIFKRYIPTLGDPYLQLFGDGAFELTAEGDTIIGRVNAGTTVTVEANNSDAFITETITESINFYSSYQRNVNGNIVVFHNVGDTVMIKETPQFMMAAALSNGLYLTREPLKTNDSPRWFKMANAEAASPSSIEFSPDGDHLYVGYNNRRLIRYSNLNNAWKSGEYSIDDSTYVVTRTVLHTGQGVITDIEVDYSQGQGTDGNGSTASERVLISEGNYGGSGKVKLSNIAASAGGSGTFENIWNVDESIQGMPCYSVVMDVENINAFMVGTEYGVYYTDNAGVSWTDANNGDMNRVPIFDLRQQKLPAWRVNNRGVVYAGSHGRGVFKTDYLLIDSALGLDDEEDAPLGGMKIYPNPLTSNGTVQFDLGVAADVSMFIYNLEGKLVHSTSKQRMDYGKQKQLRFNADNLRTGTYIVQLRVGDVVKTAKFVKTL